MSLRRFSQRALFSRPGRTILTVASIVIGVAAVVAVTIVTATTRESYQTMFAAVRGKASLEVVAKNTGPIPEDLVGKVAKVSGVKSAVPLVQAQSSMTHNENRVRLQVLGIDPLRDHLVRDMELVKGRLLTKDDKDHVLLENEFADYMGIKIGDTIKLLTPKRLAGESIGPKPMEVVGLIKMKGADALLQTGLVYMPLARAQARFLGKGKIKSVQIVTDEKAERDAVQSAIAPLLVADFEVRPPGRGAKALEATLDSTEQGLKVATLFSLLLAGFIILNTFLMSVGERRRQLAIMRAVGATRGQLGVMLIGESLALGTLGTVLGIVCGLGMASLAVWGLSLVLEVSLPPTTKFMTSPWPYLLAAAFGLGISIIGAVVPAFRASRVSPLEGMSRVLNQDFSRVPLIFIIAGAFAVLKSAFWIFMGIAGYVSIDVPRYAAVGLLLGAVLLIALVLAPFSHIAAAPIRWLSRIETSLALKQILRHRGRSVLTVGVLFVAAATGVGLANSIIDCIQDVEDWYKEALPGDYYIRGTMPDMASGTSADLPEELGPDLEQVPGIAYLDRIKMLEAQVVAGSRKTPPTADAENEMNIIVAIRQYHEPGKLPFDLIEGNESTLSDQLAAGEIVVGNILAHKMQVGVGDTLQLGSETERHPVKIAAVVNDYLIGGLGTYMEWSTGKKLFKFEGEDGFVVRAERQQLVQLHEKLLVICKKHGVLLNSNAEIGQKIDKISLGTSGCLWLLVFLGFVVASFGVVNTLSMNVLEQTRELGLLRIVAMTRKQIRWTILVQAYIIGAVGLVPGIIAGLGVGYVMNLAMEPSFGRPIAFHPHWWLMGSTLVVAMIITLIAAAIPAERAARVDLAQALHYE